MDIKDAIMGNSSMMKMKYGVSIMVILHGPINTPVTCVIARSPAAGRRSNPKETLDCRAPPRNSGSLAMTAVKDYILWNIVAHNT